MTDTRLLLHWPARRLRLARAAVISHWAAGLLSVMLAAVLAACSGANADLPGPNVTQNIPQANAQGRPTQTPAPTREVPAATPTVEPSPAGPLNLMVWWPEPLAPLDNDLAAELLSEQISGFQAENDAINVQFRLKQVADVGGIMSTLRTASAVAPGALPDLTLLRRSDLLIAAQAGLIQPLGVRLSPAVLEELEPIGLELGRVGDDLYGFPYTFDLLHVAYPDTVELGPDWRLDSFLNDDLPFIFPAGRTSGINNVLLLQYLAAGGRMEPGGGLQLDADALRTTLEFYEQAVDQNVVTPAVLEYSSPADYLDILLVAGTRAVGVIDSTIYRGLVAAGVELGAGPVPTATGEPASVVDGWMWVMTTSDVDRQTRALSFLDWMLDAERQAEYTSVINALPSQRAALRQMPDSAYAGFVISLLERSIVPLSENEGGAVARALQNALAAVIGGQRTAAEATRDLLNQFGA